MSPTLGSGANLRVNQKGLALIKEFEGFRSKAYRCPAGVWTVGYGHTSAAGEPKVGPLTVVTREEGEAILRRDLGTFERAVAEAVRVTVTCNQFSALVSFCYNVGPGAFRSSSVLKAVNAKQWNEVPRRLALWNKAGGKVLPGLVRRRAAEAALFLERDHVSPAKEVEIEQVEAHETPDVPHGKPAMKSTTNLAAGAAGVAGTVGVFADVSAGAARAAESTQTVWQLLGDYAGWIALVVLLAAVGWIIYERMKKSKEDGV